MPKQIVLERVYPYPIEQVWKAISTAEALSQWLMPTDFVLEIGRAFTFQTKPQPGFDGKVHGRVLHFEPLKTLTYTWQGGPMKKPTTVKFELTAIPEGTRLTFTHSGFEGFINAYIVRFILKKGWKDLLTNKIKHFLAHE